MNRVAQLGVPLSFEPERTLSSDRPNLGRLGNADPSA